MFIIRLQHQPLRPILPPPLLILPPHDGERVQDVVQFLAGEAVEVGVEGVQFGAQAGAALLMVSGMRYTWLVQVVSPSICSSTKHKSRFLSAQKAACMG